MPQGNIIILLKKPRKIVKSISPLKSHHNAQHPPSHTRSSSRCQCQPLAKLPRICVHIYTYTESRACNTHGALNSLSSFPHSSHQSRALRRRVSALGSPRKSRVVVVVHLSLSLHSIIRALAPCAPLPFILLRGHGDGSSWEYTRVLKAVRCAAAQHTGLDNPSAILGASALCFCIKCRAQRGGVLIDRCRHCFAVIVSRLRLMDIML